MRAWERAKELEGESSGKVGAQESSPGGEAAKIEDALDAYHSEELLRRLPGIVSRVERLEKVGAEGVTNQALQAGFREAHHCYLYGFRAACCVLCRAILEEGLREALDRGGGLEAKARGADRSYMLELLQLAVERGMLTREFEVWGRDVKKAGDFATHNRAAFDRNFAPERVEEILLKTREIVNDLYRGRRALPDGRG